MARCHTVKPRLALHMPKKISDVAIERVPSLRNRISSFQSKLAIAHYAHGTITDYCHALYKAVAYIEKLPDDFSQDDVDGYLQSMLSRKPMPAEAQFKHFVYGLKCYRQTMGCQELRGLSLPKIRREKKIPRHCSRSSTTAAFAPLRHATSNGTTSILTASKSTSRRARVARAAWCLSAPRLLSCSKFTARTIRARIASSRCSARMLPSHRTSSVHV